MAEPPFCIRERFQYRRFLRFPLAESRRANLPGIGGGAIIAPFCIAVFHLPVAVVAGTVLAGTFATSVIGIIVYSVLPLPGGGHAAPDWLLGLGGLEGMYLGAATQKHVPQKALKLRLAFLMAALAACYLLPAVA